MKETEEEEKELVRGEAVREKAFKVRRECEGRKEGVSLEN